ncbi:MAG: hypothetical protein WC675_04390 [Patescibacteria group bacterium]|jgi:hypothetical protein
MEQKNNVWTITLAIIIAAVIVGGGFYYWQQSQLELMDEAITDLKNENQALTNKATPIENENNNIRINQLLTLDASSTLCTKSPTTESSDIGGDYTIYPVADEYKTTADDYHNIAGLFTAAACGKARLNELFGSKTFRDVAIFTQDPSSSLIEYLNKNGFACDDDKIPDNRCSRWHNNGPVPLEVLVGLREWATMIYGSDCTDCG